MTKDFRVQTDFPDHPKTIKLERELGPEAIKCLLRLWAYATLNKPKGVLNDMDIEMIEIAAKWNGEPGKFVSTITKKNCLWLEEKNGVFILHDWPEHQGFIYHSEERKKKAKKAAEIRWKKKHKKSNATSNAPSIDNAMQSQCVSDAPNPFPSPTPFPNQKDIKTTLASHDKIVFDFSTFTFQNLTEDFLKRARESFPAVDVDAEIKKAARWLEVNPSKRKKNHARFLMNWFSRTQERGGSVNGSTNKPVPQDEHITYTDIGAYRRAKARGDKNISLSQELKAKYPGE